MSDVLNRTLVSDRSICAVEVKFTERMHAEDTVRPVLGSSFADPEHWEGCSFDTSDLGLFDAGVVLRTRLTRDSTVKLRPVDPTAIADDRGNIDAFDRPAPVRVRPSLEARA